MSHLLDDPLPAGMFSPDEEAIIVYARASALMAPITDEVWNRLREHFDIKSIIEVGFIVGMHQLTTRFHRLVHTEVDDGTLQEFNSGSCRIPLPTPPAATSA